jgi:hypothetical protein
MAAGTVARAGRRALTLAGMVLATLLCAPPAVGPASADDRGGHGGRQEDAQGGYGNAHDDHGGPSQDRGDRGDRGDHADRGDRGDQGDHRDQGDRGDWHHGLRGRTEGPREGRRPPPERHDTHTGFQDRRDDHAAFRDLRDGHEDHAFGQEGGDLRVLHERGKYHDLDHWRRGRWVNERHGGHLGWWWVVGDLWYFYPEPIYPYPEPYLPPDVVVPDAGTVQYWYYCDDPSGYYPYVRECAAAWEPVPTVPPPPPPRTDPHLPPGAVVPPSGGPYWYFCPDPPGYYPYIQKCAKAWEPVPTRPQPAILRNGVPRPPPATPAPAPDTGVPPPPPPPRPPS